MVRVAAGYFFFFIIYGTMMPYLSPELVKLGFSKEQSGLILASFYIFHITIPVLAGRWADRRAGLRAVIRFFGMGMVLFAAALWLSRAAGPLLFIACLLGLAAARSPMIPLLDAMAMQAAEDRPPIYARLRVLGSLGFIVASVGTGMILGQSQGTGFWLILLAATGAFCAMTFWLPLLGQPSEHAQHKQPFWHTLNRTWWVWIAGLMCHWFSFGPYHFGFTFYLQEAGVGTAITGWFWSIAVIAEIICFLAAGAVFSRWSARAILLTAVATSLIRWLILALFPSPLIIAFSQILHGPGFALFYAAAIQSVTAYCQGNNRASYLGLFATCVGGIASIIGTAAAGWLYQRMPFRTVFLCVLPLQLLALTLLLKNRLVPFQQANSNEQPTV